LEEVSLSKSFAIFHEEEVNLLNSFAPFDDNYTYHVPDKSPEDKVFEFIVEPIDYVDFIGIDAILSHSSNQNCDKIYMAEGNVLSKGGEIVAIYLRTFMAYGKDKTLEKNDKIEVLPSGVWGFHDKHQGIPMMRSVTLILGCYSCLDLKERASGMS
jgi:hypothetical protein